MKLLGYSRPPGIQCLPWEAVPDPRPAGSGIPLGSHSFPITVCAQCLSPSLGGELLEGRDHVHPCIPGAQPRSWHRGDTGDSLITEHGQFPVDWAAVGGKALPTPEGTLGVLYSHWGVEEIPVSSRCCLGTLSALDSRLPETKSQVTLPKEEEVSFPLIPLSRGWGWDSLGTPPLLKRFL